MPAAAALFIVYLLIFIFVMVYRLARGTVRLMESATVAVAKWVETVTDRRAAAALSRGSGPSGQPPTRSAQ